MQIGLRQFSHKDIEWFSQAGNCGDYSRCGLAVSLCERTNWRNKKGKLCAVQAGKILPVVADKLGLELPPVRFAKPQAGELPEYDNDVKLRCTLAQLGEVSVGLVVRSDSNSSSTGGVIQESASSACLCAAVAAREKAMRSTDDINLPPADRLHFQPDTLFWRKKLENSGLSGLPDSTRQC